MINTVLWEKILAFDLDNAATGEYGFTARLAFENQWTATFTEEAIVEYKKFMYLAATSEQMVSPSEIVDIVWHLHLIFTQSYEAFCQLLGKKIQHIPSTHSQSDYQTLQAAKQYTQTAYTNAFGEQPSTIWQNDSMFTSLNLAQAKRPLKFGFYLGILIFVILTVPAYSLLKPIYTHIDGVYFVPGLAVLSVLTFLLLKRYNQRQLDNIVAGFDNNAFIFKLQPYEAIYLKTQNKSNIVHGHINELIEKGTVTINADKTLSLTNKGITFSQEQQQIIDEMTRLGKAKYDEVCEAILSKYFILNIENSLEAFRKYFINSTQFHCLFYKNYAVLIVFLLLPFTRIITGIVRDKSVEFITIATIFLGIIALNFLGKLLKEISKSTIPEIYKSKIRNKEITKTWQWKYFLLGSAALIVAFQSLIQQSQASSGDSSSDSDGSSSGGCSGCGGGD